MLSVKKLCRGLRPLVYSHQKRLFGRPIQDDGIEEDVRDIHSVHVLGVPMFHGQSLMGTQNGPKSIRDGGLIPRIQKLGYLVEDCGDLDIPKRSKVGAKGRFADVVGEGCRRTAEAYYNIAKDDDNMERMIVALGGDHSIGLGTVAGALKARPDTGVIWVDAHADLHTPNSSASGNLHGMPVGIGMQIFQDPMEIPGHEWLKDYPALKPEQVVFIGLRDVDPPERLRIREHKIKCFSMHDVDRYGIGEVMKRALDYLKDRPLHVSFDIDACDPCFAGSTGTTARGGLTFREASYLIEACASRAQLMSFDLVEVNPSLGNGELDQSETVETAISMIESACGATLL